MRCRWCAALAPPDTVGLCATDPLIARFACGDSSDIQAVTARIPAVIITA